MTFLFEKQLLQENKIHIIWIVTWDLRQVSSLPIERICKENGVMAIKHYKDILHKSWQQRKVYIHIHVQN